VELDPELAEPHVTHAIALMFWEWDWTGAERELQQALRLAPKLRWRAPSTRLYLITCSRLDEALPEALLATRPRPAVGLQQHGGGVGASLRRRPREGRAGGDPVSEIVPGPRGGRQPADLLVRGTGPFDDAAKLMSKQRAWGLQIDGAALLEALQTGGPDAYWEARHRLDQGIGGDRHTGSRIRRSCSSTHQGRFEEALDHAERMVEAHVGGTVFLGVDPCLRPLHGHPRYEALISRVGIPRRTASGPHTASR
jgi:hypothetical protein